jgi:4-amino-4-deoxy-L-arabinose transferase-like glycosyltransferase
MLFKGKSWGRLLAKYSTPLILLAIVLVATFLRLYKLDFKSMWIDELYSVGPTNPANQIDFIINYCKSDQPPLYFLLLHYWFKAFAYTSFFARLLSVFIGILGVIAMYFLGKEIKNKQVGLMASFLVSINYFAIYYSQEARFYSLLFLLTVISFIFFIRSLKYKTLGNYIGYVFSTSALLYTQYFGILIFLIQGVVFLIFVYLFKEKIKFISTGILLAVLISASFLPWIPTILYDLTISSYWIEKPEPYFFLVFYYLYWDRDIVVSTTLLIVAFPYIRYYFILWRQKEYKKFEIMVGSLLFSWILLSYAIPYCKSLFSTPILIPRYTIITLPAIFLAMAMGFDLLTKIIIKSIVITILILSVGINLFIVKDHYQRIDKAQWREAAQIVKDRHEPGTLVYSNQEWWYNFYFYNTQPPIKVIGNYPAGNPHELQFFIEQVKNENQFWLLSGEGMEGLTKDQMEFALSNFNVKEKHAFFGSSAILFDRKP